MIRDAREADLETIVRIYNAAIPDLVGIFVISVAALVLGAGCQSEACSPCRPGTYPSDPSQSCSACLPCPDGGADANAVWCR